MKSIIGTYGAPIWFPNTKSTALISLHTIQNSTLCIETGCVKMSVIDPLCIEAKALKVDEHLRKLCTQFLAIRLQPEHVSYLIVTANSGLREMK